MEKNNNFNINNIISELTELKAAQEALFKTTAYEAVTEAVELICTALKEDPRGAMVGGGYWLELPEHYIPEEGEKLLITEYCGPEISQEWKFEGEDVFKLAEMIFGSAPDSEIEKFVKALVDECLDEYDEYLEPPQKIIVHGGSFHADDVLCVALAQIINPDVVVERVFEAPKTAEKEVIVADIGGGKYDHHQKDAALRPDGQKRSACGLLFADFWYFIFPDEKSANNFERDFIIPIEDQDNGFCWKPLSMAVKHMNPTWDSDETADTAFFKAVDFLKDIVLREVDRAHAALKAEELVEDAVADSQGVPVIRLEKFVPWTETQAAKAVEIAVYPSLRGGYNLGCRRGITLPEEWLKNAPEGATFVHQGLFLAAFDTCDHALEAAKSLYR